MYDEPRWKPIVFSSEFVSFSVYYRTLMYTNNISIHLCSYVYAYNYRVGRTLWQAVVMTLKHDFLQIQMIRCIATDPIHVKDFVAVNTDKLQSTLRFCKTFKSIKLKKIEEKVCNMSVNRNINYYLEDVKWNFLSPKTRFIAGVCFPSLGEDKLNLTWAKQNKISRRIIY